MLTRVTFPKRDTTASADPGPLTADHEHPRKLREDCQVPGCHEIVTFAGGSRGAMVPSSDSGQGRVKFVATVHWPWA